MNDFLLSTDSGAVKETTGVIATGDTIKNLTAKKLELESIISLEKIRVLDEAKQRDALQKNIADIDAGLDRWQDLSQRMNGNLSHGMLAAASDEVKKIAEDKEALQKDVVTVFINVSKALDVGPFTDETTISDIQEQYPAIKKIAQYKLKDYEANLKKAEKSREEFISQKQKELDQVSLNIERARYVKQTQLSEAITKVLMYIGIFL